MTDTPDPAAIAASLGKYFSLVVEEVSNFEGRGMSMGKRRFVSMQYLRDLGLFTPIRSRNGFIADWVFTPLGRAVAAAIREAWQEPRKSYDQSPPA